ncbi:MAG: hypothetical protein ACJ8GK_01665 [Luteimonas sp.]
MKQHLMVCIACIGLAQSACATRPAPGISGHWTAVNRYAAKPQEIPLSPAREFYASPLDRTLKSLLARWARDVQMSLDYHHRSDFTLYEPVSRIRTSDLQDAVARLAALYATQLVAIDVEGNAIVVREAGLAAPANAVAAGVAMQPARNAQAGRR